MDHKQTRIVAAEYAGLGAYFRQPLSDQVCGWYAADLADLGFDQVLHAMAALRREPTRRFLPMPAEVRQTVELAQGRADTAVEIANRIRGGITRFGYTNPQGARADIGEVGWQVVSQMGGWQHLCQTLKTSEIGTFFAQCRELCRVGLARQRAVQFEAGHPVQLLAQRLTFPAPSNRSRAEFP